MSSLEQRLAALELQNQRLRRIHYGVLAAAVVLIGLGAAGTEDVLRAKRLEVVNEKGDVVWMAGFQENGGGHTVVYGPNKNAAVSSHGKLEGGVTTLLNQSGKVVWQASVDDRQGGAMVLSQGKGPNLWQTRTTEYGAETVFRNQDNDAVLGIGTIKTGGHVLLKDNDDEELCRIERHPDFGGGLFALANRYGDPAVVLKSDSGDGGNLVLFNESDKKCLIAKADSSGGELAVLRSGSDLAVCRLATSTAGALFDLANNKGFIVLNMGASTDDHGTFRLNDYGGGDILQLGMAPNNKGGTLVLKDLSADIYGQIYPNDAGNCYFYQRGR